MLSFKGRKWVISLWNDIACCLRIKVIINRKMCVGFFPGHVRSKYGCYHKNYGEWIFSAANMAKWLIIGGQERQKLLLVSYRNFYFFTWIAT